jgi:hypothetical protein
LLADLVDKLIDRCISLVKHRQEQNRKLFTDFVEPAYAQFEVVHNEYIENFRNYRAELVSGNWSLPTLVDNIRKDSLFSEHQRSKFRSYALLMPPDPLVSKFVGGVFTYLHNPDSFILGEPDEVMKKSQRWRTTLLKVLDEIKEYFKIKIELLA